MGLMQEFYRAKGKVHDEVRQYFTELGEQGVAYAKANGNYRDRTGNLRRSNSYIATDNELILQNTASYASDVEARGYDVLGGAKLHIRKELNK